MARAGSTAGFCRFILFILALVIVLCAGEVSAQVVDQFSFRMEFDLLPCIYFLHYAFELAMRRHHPKLNDKCIRVRSGSHVAAGKPRRAVSTLEFDTGAIPGEHCRDDGSVGPSFTMI